MCSSSSVANRSEFVVGGWREGTSLSPNPNPARALILKYDAGVGFLFPHKVILSDRCVFALVS